MSAQFDLRYLENRETVYCPHCGIETIVGDVCRVGLEYVRCYLCRQWLPVTLELEVEWMQYRLESEGE